MFGETVSPEIPETEQEFHPNVEKKEDELVLPVDVQTQYILEMALQHIRLQGDVPAYSFFLEAMALAESLVQESPNFDTDGLQEVKEFCAKIQPELNGVRLKYLEDSDVKNVMADWDGRDIHISPDLILVVIRGKEEDVRYLRAVRAHEDYHKRNMHEKKFKLGSTADDKNLVTIGGLKFTRTELIEAMNTIDVPIPIGYEAAEYVKYANKLLEAVKRSKDVRSLKEVRIAINETKDLAQIEDKG